MDFGQLSLFVTLARCKQFTAAAEQAYMSQSNYSKHIKSLEEEVGVRLFTRTSKGAELTSAGEIFFKFARTTLDAKQNTMRVISSFMEEQDRNVAISLMPVTGYYSIAKMFSAFRLRFDHFILHTYEDKVDEAIRLLTDGVVNIALACNGLVDTDKYMQHVLYRDKMVLVVSANHRLAKESEVSFRLLANEPLITLDGGTGLNNIINRHCSEFGFTPHVANCCKVPSSLFSMVREGFGVAVLPLHGPISVNTEKVAIVNIREDPYADLVLISSKNRPMSKAEKAFLDFAIQWYQPV